MRPILAERPQMLRAHAAEAYLYPADLLLRGEKETIARVRARMTRPVGDARPGPPPTRPCARGRRWERDRRRPGGASAVDGEERPRGDDAAPTTGLLGEALDGTRELVRLEVALARDELKADWARAKKSALAFGTAALGLAASLALGGAAIATACHPSWRAALVVGVVPLVAAAAVHAAAPRLDAGPIVTAAQRSAGARAGAARGASPANARRS